MRVLPKLKSVEEQQAEEAAKHLERVLEARVQTARTTSAWTEISPPQRLVRRGLGGIYVDSESDLVYRRLNADVFGPTSASVDFASPDTQLWFVVDRHSELVFFEPTGEVWTELVERRERRRLGLDPPARAPRRQ